MNNHLNVFAKLLFCLFVLVGGPLHAQTPDPQHSTDDATTHESTTHESTAHSDVLNVVESAFQDLSFLLSLQSTIAGNEPLLQQLKNDYYPLFDQNSIADLTLGKYIKTFSKAHRDYVSCLIGVRFFNYHLNSIKSKDDNMIQFEIGEVSSANNSQLLNVDVSYIHEAGATPFVVRLVDRGKNSDWQIYDVVVDGVGILSLLKLEMKDVASPTFKDSAPPIERIKNLLNEKNNKGLVSSEQWCKLRENPSEPNDKENSAQLNKAQSTEHMEIKATLNGKSENVYVEVTPNGTVIYQDDIILNTNGDIDAAITSLDFRKLRLWDHAVVPYLIDRTLSEEKRSLILRAIEEFEKKTPVIFTDASSNDKNVLMFRTGNGCRSSLGMIGGIQSIILSDRCSYGTVLHEIGHALGLIHEHNRDIRDGYVNVNLQNVERGKERNFYKHPSGHPVTDSYCYSSVMHYSEHAFSITRDYKTIEVKGTHKIGQRKQLSSCDVNRIRQLYSPLLKKSAIKPDTDSKF